MFNILRKLWDKLKYKRIAIDGIDSALQPIARSESFKECTTQVCTRDKSTRARVAKAFKQQQSQMQARALKAHGSGCKDVIFCDQRTCFKREPDSIKSKCIVKRRMTKGVLRRSCTKKLSE